MNRLEAYKEILETINRCAAQVELPDIGLRNLSDLIKTEEVKAEFGIDSLTCRGATWFVCGEYAAIGCFGDSHRRTISWPDDGRQPTDGEWLYCISFPTGAYIFGSDYCTDTFGAFFAELKAFNPKYLDSVNHNLYFTSDTAAKVNDALPNLLKKYRSLVNEELKRMRIAELQKELASLERVA